MRSRRRIPPPYVGGCITAKLPPLVLRENTVPSPYMPPLFAVPTRVPRDIIKVEPRSPPFPVRVIIEIGVVLAGKFVQRCVSASVRIDFENRAISGTAIKRGSAAFLVDVHK